MSIIWIAAWGLAATVVVWFGTRTLKRRDVNPVSETAIVDWSIR